MDKFEYYVNDIVMESEGYEEIKRISKDVSNFANEKMKYFNNCIDQAKFDEAKNVLKTLKDELNKYKDYISKISTTSFDDFKSKFGNGAFRMGALIGALLTLGGAIGIKPNELSSSEIKNLAILGTSVTVGVGAVSKAMSTHSRKEVDKKALGADYTKNFKKNDVLKVINYCTNFANYIEGQIPKIKSIYLSLKKEYPDKTVDELIKMARSQM